MRTIELAGRTPAQKQGLLSQLVVPRPIAMITTIDDGGSLNVAPFSYYMPVSGEPPIVAVTVGAVREATDEPKDTWLNLRGSGEFVINVTTVELAERAIGRMGFPWFVVADGAAMFQQERIKYALDQQVATG